MSAKPAASRLLVVMFTDIASSLAIKSAMGMPQYGRLITRHDELFRAAVQQAEGEVLADTGDGFMAGFRSASQAVTAAVFFQHNLMAETWDPPLRVRVGIHVGEVTELQHDAGGRPKMVGLAADMAARLMSLGLPGQIVLSRPVFDDARQYLRQHPADDGSRSLSLRWMAHGRYMLQGSEDPLDVYEVGTAGESPLQAPPDSSKARRMINPADDAILGWRPAAGLEIPRRDNWMLERQLGIGGFGEVWLARHARTDQHRVFKFCFDADKLRSFRRELTLFRLLREALGDRPDIAQLYDIQLEDAPFFLESEFTEAGNLSDWVDARGGLTTVPLRTRLDLVARTADALAAAHSIGVLHKDVKPSNILIYGTPDDPRPRISDFGIGALADPHHAQKYDVTITGFTESMVESASSSATGTRMYAPPESLVGKTFTVQSDVYALGVVLYQMVVGNLRQPLAHGWESDIADPLLREDIARTVAGRPEDRFASAAELATSLRSLPARHKALRWGRVRRAMAATSVALLVLAAATIALWARERSLRNDAVAARGEAMTQMSIAEQQRRLAEASAAEATKQMHRAETSERESRETLEFMQSMLSSVNPLLGPGPQVTLKQVLDDASARIETALPTSKRAQGDIRRTLGEAYVSVDDFEKALAQTQAALALHTEALGPDDPRTLFTQDNLGAVLIAMGRSEEADPVVSETLAARTRILGADVQETLTTKSRLAMIRQDQQRFQEAEQLHSEVIDAKTRTIGIEHRETLESMASFADLLEDAGKLEQAEAMARKAAAICEAAHGAEDVLTLSLQSILASILSDMGRDAEAEPIMRRVITAKTKVYGSDNSQVMISVNVLALILEHLKRYEEETELLRKIVADAERVLGPQSPATLTYKANLGRAEQLRGNLDEAEKILKEVLAVRDETLGDASIDTLITMNSLGLLLLDRKKPEEALPIFEKMAAGLDAALPEGHWMRYAAFKNVGEAHYDLKQYEEAEKRFLASYEGLNNTLSEQHERTRGTIKSLADLYQAWGKPELEAPWRAKIAPADTQPATASP